MAEKAGYTEIRIDEKLKKLRDKSCRCKGGFRGAADDLIKYLEGTDYPDIPGMAFRQKYVIELVTRFVEDKCDAEILLMALGLLKGYNSPGISGCRMKYTKAAVGVNPHVPETWLNPDEKDNGNFKNLENRLFEELAAKLSKMRLEGYVGLAEEVIAAMSGDFESEIVLPVPAYVSEQHDANPPLTLERRFQNKFDELLLLFGDSQDFIRGSGKNKVKSEQLKRLLLIALSVYFAAFCMVYLILCVFFDLGAFTVDVAGILAAPEKLTAGTTLYWQWFLINAYLPAHFAAKAVLNGLKKLRGFSERVPIVKFLMAVPAMWAIAILVMVVVCQTNAMLTGFELSVTELSCIGPFGGIFVALVVYILNGNGKR